MVHNKIQKVPFRRKREQKTNYKRRMALLKSGKKRLVVRIFNRNVLAQLIEYKPTGDKVLVSAYSKELEGKGWNQSLSNTSAAYLTGLLLSQKLKNADAVLDTGLQRVAKGSKIYACLKGCLDGGMNVPHSEGLYPSDDRIRGEHVANYASEKSEHNQFSKIKNAKDIVKIFDTVKDNITKVKGAK
jgi:large subunit ribosomal protein L18